jgi:hypothetical protein
LRENKIPAMRYGYRLTHPTAKAISENEYDPCKGEAFG